MMSKIRFDKTLPFVFLLFAAFVVGFVTDDVRASGGDPRKWVASLQLLPQRLESLASISPDAVAKDKPLAVVETYSAVMARIKADYYGKAIDERKMTYSAIRGMLHSLDDPYTRFLSPEEYGKMKEENEGNFSGIGAQLDTNSKGEVYIKEPYPKTPASRAGIKSNDVITAVDNKSIKGKDILDVVKLIRGEEGTKVRLTIRRAGRPKPFDIIVTRAVVPYPMVKFRMADERDKIGYLRLYQFNEKSDEQFDSALSELEKKNMRGLVLDLRGNPGGLLHIAVDIGSRFIQSGPVVVIQERGGQKNPYYVEESKHNHKLYPLVVLVDKSSASASEIVAGAIKDVNAGTLVGTTTFGKGRVQTIMPMQDSSAVAITTAKYLTPKGTDIHKKGIVPDYEVEQPELEALLEKMGEKYSDDIDPSDPKYDVQLSKAIEILKVNMGILPRSVLDQYKKTAEAKQ